MLHRSPILETLADLYTASQLGRTGIGDRPFPVRFEKLLTRAGCTSGDAYANALTDLREADGRLLQLKTHRRSGDIQSIGVPLSYEAALFARVGRSSPTAKRTEWASLMREAANWEVPEKYTDGWKSFCLMRAEIMQRGEGWSPFRRSQRRRAHLQLQIAAKLLAWDRPALLRTVSKQVTDDTKFLERCRGVLESLLSAATGGRVRSLADLHISDNPRHVVFHGPVLLRTGGASFDYTGHAGESSLSENDLARATSIESTAPRCISVENETTFHELVRLRSGDLFVLTSYPNRATVEFLRRLPLGIARYHFGDTDPWGFDVLRCLRLAVAPVEIVPLHMAFASTANAAPLTDRDRGRLSRLLTDPLLLDVRSALEQIRESGTKGDFEQERLSLSGGFPYRRTSDESGE